MLRQIAYGYDPDTARLQRVLEIVELKNALKCGSPEAAKASVIDISIARIASDTPRLNS